MAIDFARAVKTLTGGSLFTHAPTSVIGVDVGSSSVKVVQLRNDKGKVVLETYGEIATGPYADRAIGQAAVLDTDKLITLIKDLMQEANVTTVVGAVAIPLRSSLLIVMELPNVKDTELSKVIPIEARKYIPVPISEVALDWWEVPRAQTTFEDEKKEDQKREVLVVAIHKETLTQYQSVATGAGIHAESFEIETFSTIRSSLVSRDMATTALIDLGASTSKMTIVDYGVVKRSHTISKGGQDITAAIARSVGIDVAKAEELKREIGLKRPTRQMAGRGFSIDDVGYATNPIVEYIFAEANRVIVDYQKKYKRSVDRVILTGGGALLKGIDDVAVRYLGAEVTVSNPFDKVVAPAFLGSVLREAGPEFAVAIGLALRQLQGS